jgi:hypothetical protein
MAVFQVGTTVDGGNTPTISVDVSANAPLSVGTHTFQLVVVDDSGNASDPQTATVVIKDTQRPTAVITISPTQVEPGQAFILDGRQSSDVPPGAVVQYIWTMVS